MALEALLAAADDPSLQPAIAKGFDWLLSAVETGRHKDYSPIGFYFAKLWYHERLYPLIFTTGVLGQAVKHYCPRLPQHPASTNIPTA